MAAYCFGRYRANRCSYTHFRREQSCRELKTEEICLYAILLYFAAFRRYWVFKTHPGGVSNCVELKVLSSLSDTNLKVLYYQIPLNYRTV